MASRERKRQYKPKRGHRVYAEIVRLDPCSYCGCPRGGTVDHIESAEVGHHWENMTGACRECNIRKRDRSALMFMLIRTGALHRPERPRHTWQRVGLRVRMRDGRAGRIASLNPVVLEVDEDPRFPERDGVTHEVEVLNPGSLTSAPQLPTERK